MVKPGPGKFESCEDIRLAEVLYGMSLDGDLDDEASGDGDWYGFLVHRNEIYILHEDPRGFFTYTHYANTNQANVDWETILHRVNG